MSLLARYEQKRNMERLLFGTWSRGPIQHAPRFYTSRVSPALSREDVISMLEKRTWSVKSLLGGDSKATGPTQPASKITKEQLHHLLRLSALPLPKSEAEEAKMIGTLDAQLRFVEAIQTVDTAGVEPLQSLRDETEEGRKETEITLASMKEDLEMEGVTGRSGRIRNRSDFKVQRQEAQEWDPLALATKKMGRYIVVDTTTSSSKNDHDKTA
ncbi:hypothetical protein MMC25_002712 [Agyrium rufum]|nr:hypothetical protein [Agyrium rufum]